MTTIFELGVWQLAFWQFTFTIAIAWLWVVYGEQHRNPQHDRELAWWLWHWFTGGPVETFRAYPGSGGWPRRSARRTALGISRCALTAGVAAGVYVQAGAPYGTQPATVAAWGVGGVAVLSLATLLVAYVAMEWSMWRHYIQPMLWALADDAGWDLDMRWWDVRRAIHIPRNGDDVVITCGVTFKPTAEKKRKIVEIATTKAGLSSVKPSWREEGIHRHCKFIHQEPVPDKVRFNPDIRTLIEEESTPSKVLLGFSRGDEAVWLDLEKCPHTLITSGTGGGKTAALTAIVSQLMYHGADVWVLDFKKKSHLWLRDLAGVRYARTIEEIHDLALAIGAEADRRYSMWDDVTFEQDEAGEGPHFNRLVIVCEEWSSTMDYLREHWAEIKPPGAPQRSAAVKAMAKTLNMGREVSMNVFTVCQRAESNAVGSKAMMENYQAKILIDRYSQKTWNIVTDAPFKPGLAHTGRAQVCIGPDSTEVQILLVPQAQAQRWVIDKRGMQPLGEPVPHPADTVSPGETVGDAGHYGTRERVTLWEASKDKGRGIVALNFEALKKQAQRDRPKGRFPEPVGKRGDWPTFDPRDLQEWQERKTTTVASDGVAGGRGNEGDEVDRVDTRERESEGNYPEDNWLQQESSSGDIDWEEFYANVAARDEAGCERWTAGHNGDGYGYMRDKAGRVVAVHRLAYEDQVGPIAKDLVIDHICGTKDCTRGDHLQAVTNGRNVELRHERDRARQGVTT